MELIPDEFIQPQEKVPPKIVNSSRYLVVGVVGALVLVVAAAVYYGLTLLNRSSGGNGNGVVTNPTAPLTQKQMIDAISVRSSTTTPAISAAERQKLMGAISQLATTTKANTKVSSSSASAPALNISAEQQQQLLQAIQQKTQ